MKKLTIYIMMLVFVIGININLAYSGEQPRMQETKELLEKAKQANTMAEVKSTLQKALEVLNKASDDKGGHKVNAIKYIKQTMKLKKIQKAGKLINKAIIEVEKGIEFDDSTTSKSEK